LETMSMKMATMPDPAQMPPQATSPAEDEIGALFPDEEEPVAESPWYLTWWFLAIVFAVIGLGVAAAVLMLKKKRAQSAAGGAGEADGGISMDDGFDELDGDDLIEDLPELETADDEI
jgi:hypothetical protein